MRAFALVPLGCAVAGLAVFASMSYHAATVISPATLDDCSPAGIYQVAGPDSPHSTPMSEWIRGEVPALYQRDRSWAAVPYGDDTVATAGCGPTCLSMVYAGLTGNTDFTPASAAVLSEELGCITENGTAWTFMTDGAARVGLEGKELPADESTVLDAVASGTPVICSVGHGDFTSTGHFIVLAGVDALGRLIVRDPNSPERTAKHWDASVVLPQCLNLWAFSLA